MTERPILFTAPMVRAILEGRKTMTRRVIKPPPRPFGGFPEDYRGRPWMPVGGINQENWLCPYGGPSDLLRVNETWRVGAWSHDRQAIAVDYRADDFARREWLACPDEAMFLRLVEQSQKDAAEAGYGFNRETGDVYWEPGKGPTRWRSSRFMPRWASRILLEVTAIRVERLEAITEEDAKAEGAEPLVQPKAPDRAYRAAYFHLWESINGMCSWDANP